MVIFDTTVLIALYRGNIVVKESIEQMGRGPFYISTITYAEFMVGAKDKADIAKIERHLANYTVIPLHEQITDIFMELFKVYTLSHRPGIADMLIAATALHYDLSVFTHNKKHFHYIPGIQLL